MAGIGFELKKLFKKRGLLATARAYGYAGIVCTGPMILGIVLLLSILFLSRAYNMSFHGQEVFVSTITYTLLFSLTVSGFFSLVVTRFIADMLYEKQEKKIMPSFWGGSNMLMLIIGELLYTAFLLCSNTNLTLTVMCLAIFAEILVVWNAMCYLTAIKEYNGILFSFVSAVIVAFLLAWAVIRLDGISVLGMLFAIFCGYGVMLVWDVVLLYRFFPRSAQQPFLFLQWFDKYLELAFVGLFINIGLFGHIVMIWNSQLGEKIEGLFRAAPYYDIPALLAFLTTLITTMNFMISVEVNFYPKYKAYYALFNNRGSIRDIKQAEDEMLTVLKSELKYTGLKQLFTTAIAISVGEAVISLLPLGFNDIMFGYFRILCVGYGLYAIANTIMLILLYFVDNRGGFIGTLIFALASPGLTFLMFNLSPLYYGFGFVIACGLFFVIMLARLTNFTRKLSYHLLSRQPLVEEHKTGIFTSLGLKLDRLFAQK
nr:exopolysaccharide Pel transporter PelG [Liquorilactobacillus satsumensis]